MFSTSSVRGFFIVALGLLAAMVASTASAAPTLYKQDAQDFYQKRDEPKPPFPYPGPSGCVPVSAANGIVWLADHGYTRLPTAGAGTQAEYDIVQDLATEMNTDWNEGTAYQDAEDGLKNYLTRAAFYPATASVEGRGLDLDGACLDNTTDWNWVVTMLARSDTCVLVTGDLFAQWRFTGNPWGTDWDRLGGHSIFLVGYDGTDKALVHDPDTGPAESRDEYGLTWQGSYYTLDITIPIPSDYSSAIPGGTEIRSEARWTNAIAFTVPDPATLAGDANLDHVVDALDYVVVSNNYGVGSTWIEGDVNGDGEVNALDYVEISNNYGSHAPEPATLALVALGCLGLVLRRKRR
ncbi:MAG TPA: dockerin type I domain-containing protein [Phycisphaerae bacterium]|nr:dockerin type I domain-containing protein [Phycisphaerae bacterium]